MKSTFILAGIVFLVCSCKKEVETITTTIQIRSAEYFSDAPINNIDFQIKESYGSSNYVLIDSTNEYGIYFGSFEHPANKSFEIEVTTDYLNPFGKIQLIEGEHNVVDINVIDVASLQLELDCSGTGYIQNIQCYPIVYYSYDSPLYGYSEGDTKGFPSGCSDPQFNVSIFAGQWVMSYQWRPSTTVVWTTLNDTLNIEPGQDYLHTIVY